MDLIDRDEALEKMADYVASGHADSVEDFEEYSKAIVRCKKVEAIPLSVIDEIKAELNTHIQAHSSPKDDVFFCLDYVYRIIDEKVKEYME